MAASEFCISMSALVKSILRLRIVLDPLKQISADLNKAKEVLNNNNNNNNNNKYVNLRLGIKNLYPGYKVKLWRIHQRPRQRTEHAIWAESSKGNN